MSEAAVFEQAFLRSLAQLLHAFQTDRRNAVPSPSILDELRAVGTAADLRTYRSALSGMHRDLERTARLTVSQIIVELSAKLGVALEPGVPSKRISRAVLQRIEELATAPEERDAEVTKLPALTQLLDLDGGRDAS